MPAPVVGPQATIAAITVEQGVTFRGIFRWTIDAVPKSLTGYSATLGISRRPGRVPIVTVTSADDEIALEPLDVGGNPQVGLLSVVIPPEKTTLLTRNGYYDLVLVKTADAEDVTRIYEGPVTVRLAVVPFVAPG